MKRKGKSNVEEDDDILKVLKARSGAAERFDYARVDSALLGMAVASVTGKDGQVSFGCSRDGSQAIVTVWYKGFPTKSYYATPEEMMQGLAFTLDLFLPKSEEFDSWRTYAEEFKKGF